MKACTELTAMRKERTDMRKTLTALIAALLLLTLCACGGGAGQYKVSYVAGPGPVNPALVIYGTLDGEEMRLGLREALQDYTVKDVKLAKGETMTLQGTDDGLLRYDGGVIATLEDAEGKTFDVTVAEGSTFSAEKEGETVRLLPPGE